MDQGEGEDGKGTPFTMTRDCESREKRKSWRPGKKITRRTPRLEGRKRKRRGPANSPIGGRRLGGYVPRTFFQRLGKKKEKTNHRTRNSTRW